LITLSPPSRTPLDLDRCPASASSGNDTPPRMTNAAVANRVGKGMSAADPVGADGDGFDFDISALTLTAR
jgi:hypothetical protein